MKKKVFIKVLRGIKKQDKQDKRKILLKFNYTFYLHIYHFE